MKLKLTSFFIIFLFSCNYSFGAKINIPKSKFSTGTVDISNVTATKNDLWYDFNGAVSSHGFIDDGQKTPAGMNYLTFWVWDSSNYRIQTTCSSSLITTCEVMTLYKHTLKEVVDLINTHSNTIVRAKGMYIQSQDPKDLCFAWVLAPAQVTTLSDTISVGNMSCFGEIQAPTCILIPSQINIDLGTIQAGSSASGKNDVSVSCDGGTANIFLQTLGSGDGGDVSLSGSGSPLTAKLTLNNSNAGQGLSFNVSSGTSVSVNVKATVNTAANSSGVYQGSVPLQMTYH
jgi:hypothetical protein